MSYARLSNEISQSGLLDLRASKLGYLSSQHEESSWPCSPLAITFLAPQVVILGANAEEAESCNVAGMSAQ